VSDALAGLEPALLWERFFELTRIARPPKEEGAAREHVLAWAAARSLESAVDDEGNVVVRVPATRGREDAPVVVLQAHLDMVCERDPSSPFDPREGKIDVTVDGDWVVANGTTLGADNGVGVAAAMTVVDDPGVARGPLELLFTVSEEQGLGGAKALDPSLVSGRLLVNLDGTSDEALTVGCAGSDHTFMRVPLEPAPALPSRTVAKIELTGAKGGHSGGDIASGRTNAIKALGRVLAAAYDVAPFGLVSLDGGVSRNAIPRDASAVVAIEAVDAFEDAARAGLAAIAQQYSGSDDDLRLAVTPTEAGESADNEQTRRILDLVAAIPTGVVAMAPSLPGVVETSTSLTVARTEAGSLTLASMARSSNAAALDELRGRLAALARLGKAEIEVRRSYPPWEPRLDSRLLETAKATFERLFRVEPGLAVVHGGLECAVLGQRLPGVEMVSIGPEIVGPHAPGERVRISSTQRFYRLLGALLDDLS
jgi:dipeptidase D